VENEYKEYIGQFLPRDAMHSAIILADSGINDRLDLVIVNMSVCPTVCLSVRLTVTFVDCAHIVRPTIMISSAYGSPMILLFCRQISSSHSNGMAFKFEVKYKCGRQECGFQQQNSLYLGNGE